MSFEEMLAQGWRCLHCTKAVLDISIVLCSGQSFRWKEEHGCWTGVHKSEVWQLRQDDQQIWFRILNDGKTQNVGGLNMSAVGRKRKSTERNNSSKGAKVMKAEDVDVNNNDELIETPEMKTLVDYFQLSVDLNSLCQRWIESDSHFAEIHRIFLGVRMLRQNPVENLFSFICSSNNNITRISSMVEKLCVTFGEKIHCTDNVERFSFPRVEVLAQPKTEETLRKLGFGYRAKYIHQSAVKIHENGGKEWLHTLRDIPYEEAHAALVKLPGIGAKVADCICMMSLDKTQAIPVDTHVWQIATRDYNITKLKGTKTLTTNTYKAIGDFFRKLWGSHAAWAMNFLFVADLKQFQHHKQSVCGRQAKNIARPKRGGGEESRKKCAH